MLRILQNFTNNIKLSEKWRNIKNITSFKKELWLKNP